MDFSTLQIQSINCVLEYSPTITHWTASGRSDHIIGIKYSGSALHDFGYQQLDLCAGSIFFLNQRDDYSVQILEPGTSYSVHFTTYEPISTNSFCLTIGHLEEAARLIKQIHHMYLIHRVRDNMALSNLYLLCALLDSYRHPSIADKEQRLLLAKEYLDLHFRDENSLDHAAELCGISRRRFNDLFKLQFSLTPNQYLTQCRINHAKNLLRYSHATVTEAAQLSGFSDIYYFSKVFKSNTGYNPSQYASSL